MTPGDNVIEIVLSLVDQITKPLNNITQQLGAVKGLALAALGGWSIGKFIANINEGEQVAVKLDNAFKNLGANARVTRKGLDDLAESIQNTTVYSSETVKEGEALLLTFTKVRGEVFERTTKSATDMAAAMGTSLVGAMQMLGRAVNDPILGMSMLRRARVSLTAAEREAIKTMAESGDLFGAQMLLLDAIDKRYTNTAATMRNTLGGALTALQNQIGDILKGDRGSFQGMIDAIEELNKELSDPKFKKGVDTFVAGLMQIGSAAFRAVSYLSQLLVATAEYNARIAVGSDQPLQRLNDDLRANIEEQKKAQSDVDYLLTRVHFSDNPVWKQKLAEAQATLALLVKTEGQIRTARTQTLKEIEAGMRASEKKKNPAMSRLGMGPAVEAEDAVENLAALEKSLRTDMDKVTADYAEQLRIAITAASLTDEQLVEQGKTRVQVNAAINSVNKQYADAVEKIRKGKLAEELAKFDKVMEIDIYVKPIKESAFSGLLTATQSATEQAAQVWKDFFADLDQRLLSHDPTRGITQEQYDIIAKRYTDVNLEEIKITVPRVILALPPDPMADFRKQMAETLQTTFADVFDSLGEGSGRTFAVNFLKALKRTFAEAAALNLMKWLKLDEVTSGTGSGGGIGKVLSWIFPSSKRATPGAQGGGGDGLSEVAITASRIDTGVDGTVKMATEVATQVATSTGVTMTTVLDKFFTGFNTWIKPIFSGLWKLVTSILGSLMEFIKNAIATIRAMMASTASGGGGMSFMGAIVAGIGAYFTGGASLAGSVGGMGAGGGNVPATAPTRMYAAGGGKVKAGDNITVGEEGPELFVPDVPGTILNKRQIAFAGLDTDKAGRVSKDDSATIVEIIARQVVQLVGDDKELEHPVDNRSTGTAAAMKAIRQLVKATSNYGEAIAATKGKTGGQEPKNGDVTLAMKAVRQLVLSTNNRGAAGRNQNVSSSRQDPEDGATALVKTVRQLAHVPATDSKQKPTPKLGNIASMVKTIRQLVHAPASANKQRADSDVAQTMKTVRQLARAKDDDLEPLLKGTAIVKTIGADKRVSTPNPILTEVAKIIHKVIRVVSNSFGADGDKPTEKHADDVAPTARVRKHAAGGGRVSGGTIVGEEGPELFFGTGMVMNQRQLAFSAGSRGGDVNFAPSYNIVINGAKNDKEIMGQMAAYISKRDEETKAEIYESMRKNGMGRMRR